jgi:hypothetical protein
MSSRFPAVVFALLILVMAGCSSGPRVADAASLAEAKKAAPPVMQAEAGFFEGRLLVETNLGRGFRPRLVKRRSGSGLDNPSGTVFYIDPQEKELEDDEDPERYLRYRNSSLPPVALRLRVYNTTAAPVDVEFLECKSYLGNFAVRPEKITIAPGESGQPDAMVSLLGVTGTEIPVTVTLRLDGKTETQTLILTSIKPAKPSAP